MESNSKTKIVVLIEQLIQLLRENDEEWWANVMNNLMKNYIHLTHSKTKQEAAALIKDSMLGGMGSFSDLILHRDGQPIWEETRQLQYLREELFLECQVIQYGRLSSRLVDTFDEGKYRILECDVDGLYVYFRTSPQEEPLGKFFFSTKEDLEETLGKEDSNRRIYALRLPIKAVVRFATIKMGKEGMERLTEQIYIDQPWKIKGLDIVPLEEAGEILEKSKQLKEELDLRIRGMWKDVEGQKSPLAQACEKKY